MILHCCNKLLALLSHQSPIKLSRIKFRYPPYASDGRILFAQSEFIDRFRKVKLRRAHTVQNWDTDDRRKGIAATTVRIAENDRDAKSVLGDDRRELYLKSLPPPLPSHCQRPTDHPAAFLGFLFAFLSVVNPNGRLGRPLQVKDSTKDGDDSQGNPMRTVGVW